jgi:DNA-binding NarL/FixJ family response regulator
LLKSVAAHGLSSRIPLLLGFQVDLIEAYVLCGRFDDAAEVFQLFRTVALPYRTRWAMLAAARAGALVAIGESSLGVFEQAIKLWRAGDSGFELGRTLMSYGDRLTSLGHVREGREQYLAARIAFTEQGATSWAARANAARSEREELASEHPLLAALTTEERLVAGLACRGMRNKEIAHELFVSLRTVEVRLTRIYQKLNISSRTHLIAMLSGLNAAESSGPEGAA